MSLLVSGGTVEQEEDTATMTSPTLPSDGSSISRIGGRMTMEENISSAEAHSPSQHPDFFSLPHPLQDTRTPSLVTSRLLQESSQHHSESKPSPEQHRDLMHPAVGIPRAHGNAVYWQPAAMPGMWFPPRYSGYYPQPTMYPVAIPWHGRAMNLHHPLVPGMWFPTHYPSQYPSPTYPMPPSQNMHPLDEKKGTATLHASKRLAESIPVSKKTKKAKGVTPPQDGPINAAEHNRLRGVTVRPSGQWVSCTFL
jgi:hypothetical protein